ncbi:MAG: HEAT repeat domain-containing protein [Armatimonadota bacterium]
MRLWIVIMACVLLAAAWGQPGIEPLPIAQETDTARLLVIAAKSKPADRVQAIARLGRLHFSAAVPNLIPMLAEPDAGIRTAAATTLGQLCEWRPEKTDDRAVAPLILLLKDDAAPVRAAAVKALGEIRALAGADDLAVVMEKDKDAAVRRVAAMALAEMDDARAIAPLREMVKTADTRAQQEVAWALMGKRDPQALDLQLAMLATGDSQVRRVILEGLSFSRFPGIVPAVCAVMTDPSPEVRRLAVECLRMQGDVQAVPALLAALDDADPEVARLAGKAFTWHGNYGMQLNAIDGLLAALKSPKTSARAAALEGLYGSDDPRISPAVIPLMSDKNAGVRAAAARTLGGLGDPRALDPLIALLQSPDAKQRISATEALGALRRKEAVAPLLPLLKDADTEVRRVTAEALGNIRDPAAVDALLAALTEKNNYVRSRIVSTLGACRDKKATPALLALLQTEQDKWVQTSVVYAFRHIRDPRCIDPILAFYERSKGEVRAACLPVLASYPGTQVKDMLLKEMASTDAMTQETAIRTASTNHIYDERMVPLLLNVVKNAETQRFGVDSAVTLLINMKKKQAIEPFITLLKSKRVPYRRMAVIGLRMLADEKVIPALLPLANDPEPYVAMEARAALLHFGHQESLQVLLEATASKDEMTRGFAMKALSDSGNPRAVTFIQSQFLNPQSPNRLQAAYLMQYSMTPNFLETVLAMANGTDQTERKLATVALAGNLDLRARAIQQRILREGQNALPEKAGALWLLQERAAVSLAKQGNPEGIAWLIDAVGNPDGAYGNSQENAARILAEITGQDLRLDAEGWKAWWEEKQKAGDKP